MGGGATLQETRDKYLANSKKLEASNLSKDSISLVNREADPSRLWIPWLTPPKQSRDPTKAVRALSYLFFLFWFIQSMIAQGEKKKDKDKDKEKTQKARFCAFALLYFLLPHLLRAPGVL